MIPDHRILAHHSEAVDPTLVEWIRHQIDRVVGLEPAAIVTLLGILIVLFPLALMFLAWRRRRLVGNGGEDGPAPGA